ncbi:MAG: AraC family transcriptional regulator [Eubacterium sp.]|nr:AraC family transcriptional regulator [Eubacterium sp.]
MLVYYSLQPNLCTSDLPEDKSRAALCGELLTLITANHIRSTRDCLSKLENEQIILGNGGFIAVSVFFEEEILFDESNLSSLDSLIKSTQKHLKAPIYFCYTSAGHIYYLICYPRLDEKSEGDDSYIKEASEAFKKIYNETKKVYPKIHFLLSDMLTGEKSIFITTNSLNHAKEYCLFKTSTPTVTHISMQDVLHGGFITDTDQYHSLCVAVTKTLVSNNCDCNALSEFAAKEVLKNAAPSMESVHHHAQIFMLSFTEYLTENGVINSSYLDRKEILHRVMRFETEIDFINNLTDLLSELRRQFFMLESVGKKDLISTVRSFIDENITDPSLSLQSVAEHFDLSPTQLTRQFKGYFGITLYSYLQQQRFKNAQKKLQDNPKITLQQLALKSGYNDISTMYRAFKKYEGITPGNFKNSL